MVEYRQEGPQPVPDSAVGRNVVAVCVPRARGAVVAQVDRHETDSGFDESTSQSCLFAPLVSAVTLANGGWLARQIEYLLRSLPGDDIDGLLLETIHRVHRTAQVQVAA